MIDPDSLALASASPDHAPALARTIASSVRPCACCSQLFLLAFLRPVLLAWALEIRAARALLMPLSRRASYVSGFFTDGPGLFFAGNPTTSKGPNQLRQRYPATSLSNRHPVPRRAHDVPTQESSSERRRFVSKRQAQLARLHPQPAGCPCCYRFLGRRLTVRPSPASRVRAALSQQDLGLPTHPDQSSGCLLTATRLALTLIWQFGWVSARGAGWAAAHRRGAQRGRLPGAAALPGQYVGRVDDYRSAPAPSGSSLGDDPLA